MSVGGPVEGRSLAGADSSEHGRLFMGYQPRECGEHRTVGAHRAWCYDCSEWCYAGGEDACRGCSAPVAAVVQATPQRPEGDPAYRTTDGTVTDHPFIGVRGHPDDDECTNRSGGTDETYCGHTEAEHTESTR
jgi:hypothetical protein